MRRKNLRILCLSLVLLFLTLLPLSTTARPFVLVLSQDDLKDPPPADSLSPDSDASNSDWDEFGDSESKSDDELDPGSWRPIFEPDSTPDPTAPGGDGPGAESLYYSGLNKMVSAVSRGDPRRMEEGASEIEAAAGSGYAHAQSAMGFLYNMGMLRERNKAKAFMYHYFASDAGNMQSKMALAYIYSRQDVCITV